MTKKQLQVIGRNALIDIIGHAEGIPAKIDTGADTTAVWASDIQVNKAGVLSFKLFGKHSPFYTGEELTRTAFDAVMVRSSNGHQQMRYRTEIPISIKGKRIRIRFTLSDRSLNSYPILIGRRTLTGRFLVDVSQKEYDEQASAELNLGEVIAKDPHKFHKKHFKKPILRRRS